MFGSKSQLLIDGGLTAIPKKKNSMIVQATWIKEDAGGGNYTVTFSAPELEAIPRPAVMTVISISNPLVFNTDEEGPFFLDTVITTTSSEGTSGTALIALHRHDSAILSSTFGTMTWNKVGGVVTMFNFITNSGFMSFPRSGDRLVGTMLEIYDSSNPMLLPLGMYEITGYDRVSLSITFDVPGGDGSGNCEAATGDYDADTALGTVWRKNTPSRNDSVIPDQNLPPPNCKRSFMFNWFSNWISGRPHSNTLGDAWIQQYIEPKVTAGLKGKTIGVSFYAKASEAGAISANQLQVQIRTPKIHVSDGLRGSSTSFVTVSDWPVYDVDWAFVYVMNSTNTSVLSNGWHKADLTLPQLQIHATFGLTDVPVEFDVIVESETSLNPTDVRNSYMPSGDAADITEVATHDAIGTTWTRCSANITIPDSELFSFGFDVRFVIPKDSTSADQIWLGAFQMNIGNAQDFVKVFSDEEELLRIQKYCYMITDSNVINGPDQGNLYTIIGHNPIANGGCFVKFPVTMFTRPTVEYFVLSTLTQSGALVADGISLSATFFTKENAMLIYPNATSGFLAVSIFSWGMDTTYIEFMAYPTRMR